MASWEKMCSTIHGLKPTLIMVLVQTLLSLVNIGYKLAANDGMTLSVLVAYRLIFGAACIIPVAIVVERKKRPKLTWTVALYGFLCGLFGGSLGQNLYLKSLVLTSATFISAMTNLIPAITFIIAISLRLEKLGWNTIAGKAKVFGTLLGIGGAMVFTFYKGPELHIGKTGINLLKMTSSRGQAQTQNHPNLVVGLLLSLVTCLTYSLWLIIQAKAAEKYPCPYSLTGMMTFWGSIQSVIYAICVERDRSQWILGWNIRLLAALVAGVLGSGLMFTLVAWCVRMRGPLFVSIFNPLLLVIVAIVGILFLDEKLHLGMIFGAILIVCGLYIVLWGKSKESKNANQILPESQENRQHVETLPVTHKAGCSKKHDDEEDQEEEEEKRDSQASSLSGLYMYP
ncbi:WAT1-related protein At1g25270 [Sesamum indicum]|uniref:WAT1-related protein n=1 Tax=Sesamum indicum TaxID=4182 RepID=A0A6I9TSL2_SESIN|nr:WAT1-related protein At1g25270 [Sesamum indicum]